MNETNEQKSTTDLAGQNQRVVSLPWVDDCRIVVVNGKLEAIPYHIAEGMRDYVAPMSESASRANQIIRNMIKAY